jgi:NADH dehydrogenase FAD-containing subunit
LSSGTDTDKIPCTGQTPNSFIMSGFYPSSVSTRTQRILVRPTLQLKEDGKSDDKLDLIFALGDVAETGGSRMARAGMMQAEIVRENIVKLIQGKELVNYTPLALEGALKLSLGKVRDTFKYQFEKEEANTSMPLG